LGSDESNEEIACPILDTSTLWWGLGVTVLVAASAAGVNNALNQCRERNKKESAKNRKAARIVMKKLGKKLSSSQKPTKLSSKNKPVQPVSSVTQVKLVAPPPDLDDVYPRYLSSVKEANVLIALGLSSILPGQYRERGGKERKIVQLQNKIKNKAVHQVKFDELQKQSKEKELQASIQKTLTQEKEKLATILEQEIKLIKNAYIQLRKSLIKESVNLNQTPTVPSSTEHQTSTHSSPPSENDERVGNNESVAESALSEEEEEEGKEHEQEKVQEQEKEKEEDKNAKEKKEPEVFCDPRIKSTDFKVHKKEDYRSTFLSSSSAQSTKLFSLRKKQPTTSSDEIKLMHLIERIHTLEERTCTQTIRYSLEQEGEQDNLEIEVGNRMYLYQFMKIAEMLTQLYPSPDLQLVLRFRHLIVHFHEEISQTEMTLFATAWLGHYEQEKQKTHDVIAMCKQALLTTLDESDLIKEKIEKYVPRSKETARPMCGFRLFDHMHYAEQMPRLLKDIVLLTDIYVTKFTKGEQLKTALLKLRESETDVYEVCEFTLVSIYEKLKLLKKDKDIKELRIKIAHQPDEAEIQKIHSFFTEFLPEIIAIFSKHSRLKAKLAEIDLSHHGSIQKFTEKMATPTNTH